MASQLLDRPTITRILQDAGPAFLSKIRIDAMLMAHLVKAEVLLQYESQSILAETDPVKQHHALLSHLYRASPRQFVAFCLILVDIQNKEDLVTQDFQLSVEELRSQHAMHMVPTTKTLGQSPNAASVNQMVTKENYKPLEKCIPVPSSPGRVDKEFSQMAMHKELEPPEGPVILSVLGHYKKDPDDIFLLGNLLSEQIKELTPKAKIIHIVLEDQERIVDDGQDENFIGFTRPGGYPKDTAPSTDWLNFTFKTFYPYLVKYKVTHIITHAPELIWGAINIKLAFFPKAVILSMIHEQIDTIERHTHAELLKWSTSIEVILSLGKGIYDDAEDLFCCLEKNFKCDKRLCYLPRPPMHFSKGRPWKKPISSRNPVITILAGDRKTRHKQKMALPIIITAITSVAEELRREKSVMRLSVRITGIPREESNQTRESLKEYINDFIAMECKEAFSFSELEREMRRSHLCIIPLSSSTLAYGLDFIVPVGLGAPTLVPDSASILLDAKDIISTQDRIHLEKITVEVMSARSRENEERAWKDKIKNVLLDMSQAQTCAMALRQAIDESFLLARNRLDFVELLKVPPKLLEQVPFPVGSDTPKVNDQRRSRSEQERDIVHTPSPFDKPQVSYPPEYDQDSASSDQDIIKPVNRMGRLLRNWVLIATLIPPYPVVDAMLEQGSISRTVFEEVYQLEETSGQYASMSSLLRLVRSRGERGIDQFISGLRDPTVDFDIIADRIDTIKKPTESAPKAE